MFKRAQMTIGILAVSISAWAHNPPDEVRYAVQFPAGEEPVIDGDCSDWYYWHHDLAEEPPIVPVLRPGGPPMRCLLLLLVALTLASCEAPRQRSGLGRGSLTQPSP